MKKISLVVLFILLYLPIDTNAFEPTVSRKRTFDETIDSVLSKRMELPLVRSKLENPNSKFVPVYGHVMDANDTRSFDITDDEDMFVAESLFLVLNDRMLQKNDSLLKRATPDVQSQYKRLMNRFNFISLEKIRIHVDYYYDRAKKAWARPLADDSVVTMKMIVKSGYFLYQDRDSFIGIRRYGFYVPISNVKRIFFNDGYSEVLWKSPDKVSLDSMKVIPYKLVEKIPHDKRMENRKKVENLLKNRDFTAIPFVLKEMDEYCEYNSCLDKDDYRRYLNVLKILYWNGVFKRF